MGSFHLHRSQRVERLVSALGDVLEKPVGGPFEPELVVVPGRGMGVWLTRELARRFGVWAMPLIYPRGLVDQIVAAALGEAAPGTEALNEDLLEWGIRAELPKLIATPEFSDIARYLENDERGVRLSHLSARIATVFDQYLTYRPDWIRSFQGGGEAIVPEDQRFQPLLFRRVAERLRRRHVAHVEQRLLDRLAHPLPGFPPRLCLFGLSTLPPLYVRLVVALSRHVDVHFFQFWAGEGTHPTEASLARTLGTLGREFDTVLRATLEAQGLAVVPHELSDPPAPDRLFGALPVELEKPSIVVHSCHGPMREVEVLHDELLALLTRKDDPVAPEDIVVLMPDLSAYTPLVEAVFARERGNPRFIPFHIADRSSRGESPIVDALDRVLAMVRGRVTSADVTDLIVLGPVQTRLGLDTQDIDRIKGWIAECGIRWGMDAEHRASLGVPASDANTWRFGLDRLLLGYALPLREERRFEEVLPYDEIEGKDAALLGTLAAFVRSLFETLRELERPRSLDAWGASIAEVCERFFARDRDTTHELGRVRRALEELAQTAGSVGFEAELDVSVMRELVLRKLDTGSPERGFLGAGVNFCAMVPMRSIPFRVVCLLGLNDGKFPRSPRPFEFDLVHDGRLAPREGDRSPRNDDRYLFLETLAAARDRLVITYSGLSLRDNRSRPPSVCLSELLDHVAERLGVPRADVSRALVTEHRLQGFSPKYFDGSSPRLESYAEDYARAAGALVTGSRVPGPFVGRLPALEKPVKIELRELLRFWKSPAAYLLNHRLGIWLESRTVELRDREPLELDNLEVWKIGNPLIEHSLAGRSRTDSEALFRGKGQLPLGAWGTVELRGFAKASDAIAQSARGVRGAKAIPALDVRVALPSGQTVVGVLDGRFEGGFVTASYSSPKPKRQVNAWICHVVACAAGTGATTFLVGREGEEAKVYAFEPLERADAIERLGDLVTRFLSGQETALPFVPATSSAYAENLDKGAGKALDAAIGAYAGDRKESAFDPHLERAFDQRLPPFDADFDRGARELEATEFHRVAIEICGPLLRARREVRT